MAWSHVKSLVEPIALSAMAIRNELWHTTEKMQCSGEVQSQGLWKLVLD